ncbi:hypothetical protein EC968_005425 [Mortierella alpina]|nr:hypothetical protein EC968_005425 [Mortierella alpina]
MSDNNKSLSPYNKFMKDEMAKIRAGQPHIELKEAFKLACRCWMEYRKFLWQSLPPRFPNPWVWDERKQAGLPATLLAELSIVVASNAIREKPEWWMKYKDPVTASRWKQEILDASIQRGGGWVMREEQMDYVFKELNWHAEQRQKQVDSGVEAPIEVAIDFTRRSDGLIPLDLKQQLLASVKKLKDVPDHMRDWHPGSDKQILNIIDPSLFPVIAGRTLVTEDEEAIPPLDFMGRGKVLKELPVPDADVMFCSDKYQFLPTDVEVTPEGKVKFKSYINNLPPIEHRDMYPVLEGIFERFLPMFEKVLGEMTYISCTGVGRQFRLTADPLRCSHEFKDYDEEDEYYRTRLLEPVEIPEFQPKWEKVFDMRTSTPLQVIFKLAETQLTPDNPVYKGGVWHVEGMANENIVATGIYYYHSENITESRLNFRTETKGPSYHHRQREEVELVYGVRYDGHSEQYLDGIVVKEDRCIVFPNVYQCQVQPFRLEDPTKPGTRSVLVFFLVDPVKPILSTTHVPPQQKTWAPRKELLQEVREKMPPEISDEVQKLVDWPIDLDEAELHREELMKERKYLLELGTQTCLSDRSVFNPQHNE